MRERSLHYLNLKYRKYYVRFEYEDVGHIAKIIKQELNESQIIDLKKEISVVIKYLTNLVTQTTKIQAKKKIPVGFTNNSLVRIANNFILLSDGYLD